MIVHILIILLFILSFLPKIRNYNRLRTIDNKFRDFKFTNSILLIWIAIGFITRFDFSQMFGCVIYGEKILDYNNIGFASISFTLVLIARLAKRKKTKSTLLTIEMIIWLFRLFYYKGGYATGFTGNYPLDLIVLYDTIALLLRLRLIDNIKRIRFLRKWRVYLIVIFLVSVKIFVFPVPHDLFWETKRIQNKTNFTKSMLIGDWTGSIQYDSSWYDTLAVYRLDTLPDDFNVFQSTGAYIAHSDSSFKYALKENKRTIYDLAKVSIDSTMIISTEGIDFQIDFQYYNWGHLILYDTLHFGRFTIYSLNNDSLIFTITEGFSNDYKYKLHRK